MRPCSMAQCSTGCKKRGLGTGAGEYSRLAAGRDARFSGSLRKLPAVIPANAGTQRPCFRSVGKTPASIRPRIGDCGSALRRPQSPAPSPQPLLPHHPMYFPPFAARFAPVIQLAASGMKKLTAQAHPSGLPTPPVGVFPPPLFRSPKLEERRAGTEV